MKKNHRLYAIPLLALALAACTNDGLQDDPLADGPVALSVTADISTVATRAQSTVFDNGDPIGIFPYTSTTEMEAAQANKLYTYSGSAFTSTAPYYFQDRDTKYFHAYYPFNASLTAESHTITIDTRATNQTTETLGETSISWRKNDYLFASAQTSVSTPSVAYAGNNAFRHVMSQLVFTFLAGTNDGIANLQALTGYKIDTPLTMDGTFDAATGTVTLGSSGKESLEMGITGASGTSIECTPLILLPQAITDGSIKLVVTYNNVDYSAGLTIPTSDLKPGNSYSYTVTIKNKGLEISQAQISKWVESTASAEATLQ